MKDRLDVYLEYTSDEYLISSVTIDDPPVYCETRLIEKEMDLYLYRQRFDENSAYVRFRFKGSTACFA